MNDDAYAPARQASERLGRDLASEAPAAPHEITQNRDDGRAIPGKLGERSVWVRGHRYAR